MLIDEDLKSGVDAIVLDDSNVLVGVPWSCPICFGDMH